MELLIFSLVETRLDIPLFIIVAIYLAKNSCYAHIKAVKTIFYYFKGLINCGIA